MHIIQISQIFSRIAENMACFPREALSPGMEFMGMHLADLWGRGALAASAMAPTRYKHLSPSTALQPQAGASDTLHFWIFASTDGGKANKTT